MFQELGLKELHAGYDLKQGLRHVLSVMTLLTYHLITVYVLSHSDGDLELCDAILKTQLLVSDVIHLLLFVY